MHCHYLKAHRLPVLQSMHDSCIVYTHVHVQGVFEPVVICCVHVKQHGACTLYMLR